MRPRVRFARIFALLACCALLLTAAPAAQAQEPAPVAPASSDGPAVVNSITGKVTLAGGAPLAGVTVKATFVGKPRIILLPGIMGTELTNNASSGCDPKGRLWIDLWPAITGKMKHLEPLYLNTTGNAPRNAACSIDPTGRTYVSFTRVGLNREPIDPYGPFVTAAEAAGFDVLDYPGFDWRLDIRTAADKLDTWIDANATGAAPIYLVGHSMGGLVARAYVAAATRAAKIAGVVTVGTPYLGAPVMAQRIIDGLTGTGADSYTVQSQMKEIARYAPGMQMLLPSPAWFNSSASYYMMLAGDPLETYAASVDHLVGWNYIARPVMNTATAFHTAYDGFDKNFFAASKYTVLYSTAQATTPRVYNQLSCSSAQTEVCFKTHTRTRGDGTVPLESAVLGPLGNAARSGVAFCGYASGVLEHGNLYRDPNVIKDVLHALKGEPTEHCTPGVSAVSAAAQTMTGAALFRELTIWGNARVRVVDGSGNFTGVDDDGIIVQSLPNVTYQLTSGGVFITLPLDAPYRIEVLQAGDQPIQFLAADFGPDANPNDFVAQAQSTFDNIVVTDGGTLTLTAAGAPLADLRVQVDANADGTPEQTLPPDAVLTTPAQAQDVTPPTSTVTLAGSKDAQGRFTGNVTLTVTAQDNAGGAGVLASYYSLDAGQTWQKYAPNAQVPFGAATAVQVYSTDKAGNQEYPPKQQAINFTPPPVKVFLPTVRGKPADVVAQAPAAPAAAPTEAIPAPLVEGPQPALTAPAAPAALVYSAVTLANGSFSLLNLPPGAYEVTASLAGYSFTPAKWAFQLSGLKDGVNFTATTPLPGDMVLIPAGPFQMGCETSEDPMCNYAFNYGENPRHTVNLTTYAIDTFEVTNARYATCVAVGGCTVPHATSSSTRADYYGNQTYANFPVTNVDWSQASAFCAWEGKRLPTEAEWEKAARGSTDMRVYPWGNAAPNSTLLNHNSSVGDTTAIGSYPTGASPYGVLDMSGNVWEWVNDWWQIDYYATSPVNSPQGPATGDYRVLRSGSWYDGDRYMRAASRYRFDPDAWRFNIGFRCARSY